MREELDLHKFAWGNCDAKSTNEEEIKTKMVNFAFAYRFTWRCKFVSKCGI